jgi:oligopeptide transport system permease protein
VQAISHWTYAWRRFRSNSLALLGLAILILYTGIALGADSLAPYGAYYFDFANLSSDPSHAYFLGTDSSGRDVFTLMMYGARIPVAVGFIVPIGILLIGLPIGIGAGYYGGWVDVLLMRFTDVMLSIPPILLTLCLILTQRRTIWWVIIAIILTGWMPLARIARAETLRIRQQDYVLGARAIGAGTWRIVFEYLIPNLVGPIVVTTVISIPAALISEATLTYLGAGVESNLPSWTVMIRYARDSIFSRPLMVIIPAVALSTLTLAFTFVGDGLRDALDPRMIRR